MSPSYQASLDETWLDSSNSGIGESTVILLSLSCLHIKHTGSHYRFYLLCTQRFHFSGALYSEVVAAHKLLAIMNGYADISLVEREGVQYIRYKALVLLRLIF
jgi:hypothetical protein